MTNDEHARRTADTGRVCRWRCREAKSKANRCRCVCNGESHGTVKRQASQRDLARREYFNRRYRESKYFRSTVKGRVRLYKQVTADKQSIGRLVGELRRTFRGQIPVNVLRLVIAAREVMSGVKATRFK